jgi:uncharacterized membrane protein
MNELIEPNLHPLIVHFVIAFLITGPLLLFVSTMISESRRASIQLVGDWMLALGAVAVIAAVAAGLQAYYSVGHDAASHAAMTDHRNWAFATSGMFLAFSFWRFISRHQVPSKVFATLILVPVLLLGITGWKGGHLVYHYGLGVAALPAVTGDGHDHDNVKPPGHDVPGTVKQDATHHNSESDIKHESGHSGSGHDH